MPLSWGAGEIMIFLFLSVLPFYTLLPLVPLCMCVAGVWISIEVWLKEFNSLELILLLSILLLV